MRCCSLLRWLSCRFLAGRVPPARTLCCLSRGRTLPGAAVRQHAAVAAPPRCRCSMIADRLTSARRGSLARRKRGGQCCPARTTGRTLRAPQPRTSPSCPRPATGPAVSAAASRPPALAHHEAVSRPTPPRGDAGRRLATRQRRARASGAESKEPEGPPAARSALAAEETPTQVRPPLVVPAAGLLRCLCLAPVGSTQLRSMPDGHPSFCKH